MNIAVIGNSNSIFVKQFIEFEWNERERIILLAESPVKKEYALFYQSRGIQVIPMFGKRSKWVQKVPVLRAYLGAYFWAKEAMRSCGEFDVVHIQGLNRSRGLIAKFLRRKTHTLVVSVWGSELLGQTESQLKDILPYYRIADIITCETDQMISKFLNAYGDTFKMKIVKAELFLGIYEYMDRLEKKMTRQELLQTFGIKSIERLNVFVGHNGRDVQRHFEITEQIQRLPEEVKSKINLVYTMTYGTPQGDYLDRLKITAHSTGCPCYFIEGYLSEEDIAKLRLVCDVLVHAQLVDAASASLRECMYGGSLVINGSWLKYDFIPRYNERVIDYSSLDEIPEKLSDVVLNPEKYQSMRVLNKGNRDGEPTLKENVAIWNDLFKKNYQK